MPPEDLLKRPHELLLVPQEEALQPRRDQPDLDGPDDVITIRGATLRIRGAQATEEFGDGAKDYF